MSDPYRPSVHKVRVFPETGPQVGELVIAPNLLNAKRRALLLVQV